MKQFYSLSIYFLAIIATSVSAQNIQDLELVESKPLIELVSQSLEEIPYGIQIEKLCELASRGISSSTFESFVSTRSGNKAGVSVVSPEYAEYLFTILADKTHIPFGYPEDGCFARAHSMVRILEELGISAAKVFVEGDLQVETPNTDKGYVRWWYHVAPLIQVEKGRGVEFLVLDPSIFDRPVTLEEWIKVQTSHENGFIEEQYFTSRFNYMPMDTVRDRTDYEEIDIDHTAVTLKRYLQIQKDRQNE